MVFFSGAPITSIVISVIVILSAMLFRTRKKYRETREELLLQQSKNAVMRDDHAARLSAYDAECSSRMEEANRSFSDRFTALEITYEQKLAVLQTGHTSQLAALQAEHASQLTALKAEHASQLAAKDREREEAVLHERLRAQTERESLALLSEKELLVETVYSLRNHVPLEMGHMEAAMDDITHVLSTVSAKLAFLDLDISKLMGKKTHRVTRALENAGVITEEVFERIVDQVINRREYKRICEYYVDHARVNCIVVSIHGNSKWEFYVDFDDEGCITGEYIIRSENDDSTLPASLAEVIKKEIIYFLHS